MPEGLRFANPGPVDRGEAMAVLDGADPGRIAETLVALALHDPDGEWVEEVCWRLAEYRDPSVRGVAGLCLGHVARRFGRVRPRTWSVVRALCTDPEVDSRPCDGLDDLLTFAGPEPPDTRQRELRGVPTAPGIGIGVVVLAAAGPPAAGVLVAADLSPADVVALDPRVVTAVATAYGAPLSHASILARSLGIPAVTGLGADVLAIPAGTPVLVDGDAGTLSVNPTSGQRSAARRREDAARQRAAEARRAATAPAVTRDGHAVAVVVNVGSVDDARLAMAEGADGVGMLRTELAFLGRTEPPTEDEQYAAYRAIADVLGDRPLVVRTLDQGADIPARGARPEPNPALGSRGIRLTLGNTALFETQLRAIARLARDRPIGVMFPMVTTVDELERAQALLTAVSDGPIEVGITVEVPAAALTAAVFAPMVDFFAIGTNDLTQYTLAADRGNAAVAGLADGLHPGVLRLIREVTTAAARHGRSVCVVGEMGCDPLAIPVLVGLGVAALSVRPNAVAQVKQVIRGVTMAEAREIAAAALEADSAGEVRRQVAARFAEGEGP